MLVFHHRSIWMCVLACGRLTLSLHLNIARYHYKPNLFVVFPLYLIFSIIYLLIKDGWHCFLTSVSRKRVPSTRFLSWNLQWGKCHYSINLSNSTWVYPHQVETIITILMKVAWFMLWLVHLISGDKWLAWSNKSKLACQGRCTGVVLSFYGFAYKAL